MLEYRNRYGQFQIADVSNFAADMRLQNVIQVLAKTGFTKYETSHVAPQLKFHYEVKSCRAMGIKLRADQHSNFATYFLGCHRGSINPDGRPYLESIIIHQRMIAEGHGRIVIVI